MVCMTVPDRSAEKAGSPNVRQFSRVKEGRFETERSCSVFQVCARGLCAVRQSQRGEGRIAGISRRPDQGAGGGVMPEIRQVRC